MAFGDGLWEIRRLADTTIPILALLIGVISYFISTYKSAGTMYFTSLPLIEYYSSVI